MIFWGILSLMLFIIDAITATALLMGFAISAIITSVLSPIIPLWGQIILFVAVGISLTLIVVPKLRRFPEFKSHEDTLEGTIIKASSDMNAGELYQEKIKGTFWNIKCTEQITKNQNIKIIKLDTQNNCLIVKGE